MSSAVSPAPSPPGVDQVTADARALRATIDACVRDHPGASRELVEQLVWSCYERTSDAKVQTYRVVLAERDTRARLRLEERARRGDLASDGSLVIPESRARRNPE